MESDLKIGLIGGGGKMGSAICSQKVPGLKIAACYTRNSPPSSKAKVDLFIDVSSPLALSKNLQVALDAKKPIVIGTTGEIDFEILRDASRSIPIFYSANFSLGMHLIKKTAMHLLEKLGSAVSIEIIESHHLGKKDVPSGTALMLASCLERFSKIKIQSIREADITGKHEIAFDSTDERIVLIHEAKSRTAFALGALKAARFLAVQSAGFYTMDDLLF